MFFGGKVHYKFVYQYFSLIVNYNHRRIQKGEASPLKMSKKIAKNCVFQQKKKKRKKKVKKSKFLEFSSVLTMKGESTGIYCLNSLFSSIFIRNKFAVLIVDILPISQRSLKMHSLQPQ